MSHSDVEVTDGWNVPCLQTRDRSASALEVTWLPFEVKTEGRAMSPNLCRPFGEGRIEGR